MQHSCGTGKTEFLCHGNEITQMTKFHTSSAWCSYQSYRFQLAQQAIFIIVNSWLPSRSYEAIDRGADSPFRSWNRETFVETIRPEIWYPFKPATDSAACTFPSRTGQQMDRSGGHPGGTVP